MTAHQTHTQVDDWSVARNVILAVGGRADIASRKSQQVLTWLRRGRRHTLSLTLPEQPQRPVVALVVALDLLFAASGHDGDRTQFTRAESTNPANAPAV